MARAMASITVSGEWQRAPRMKAITAATSDVKSSLPRFVALAA